MKYDVMLAKTGDEKVLKKEDYIFEPKFDGYRALCYVNAKNKKIEIISRNKINMTKDFNLDIKINSESAVLDGEIIAYDEEGKLSFSDVRSSQNNQFICFDILEKDGKDLRKLTQTKRKEILKETLIEQGNVKLMIYTKNAKQLLDFVKEKKLEGIVAKKTDSRYASGRSINWVKIKFTKTIDCVVTKINSKNRKVSSLQLGLFNDKGQLIDVGAVGSGFTEATMDEIIKYFNENEKFVIEVKYHELTKDAKLRAAVFLKIRKDKKNEECTFEQQDENQLKEYEKKRDFKKTPEPKSKEMQIDSPKKIFVIQRHDARRLHYDLRLEDEGVLKSFAIPKGLSNNPSDKRLAIHTENHPMSYANFQGQIPKGEYLSLIHI